MPPRNPITRAEGEIDWGPNPFFIIAEIPSGQHHKKWRKIVIVNTQRNLITFRTCTNNKEHAFLKDMGEGRRWFLDNTMPDCPTQIMREFLRRLRTIPSEPSKNRDPQ